LGPYGSVRGALSNERPYRDLRNVVANYPFERSHRLPTVMLSVPSVYHRLLDAGLAPTAAFGALLHYVSADGADQRTCPRRSTPRSPSTTS
jgi:hypothetical protein